MQKTCNKKTILKNMRTEGLEDIKNTQLGEQINQTDW